MWPGADQIWPSAGRHRRIVGQIWPHTATFGLKLSNYGEFRPTSGPSRPTLTRILRQDSGHPGQRSDDDLGTLIEQRGASSRLPLDTTKVYLSSSIAEQTTPSSGAVTDISGTVLSLSFDDDDLDAGQLGGFVVWSPPENESLVTEYRARLSVGVGGASTGIGTVPVGTNRASLAMDTARATWSHVLVRVGCVRRGPPCRMSKIQVAKACGVKVVVVDKLRIGEGGRGFTIRHRFGRGRSPWPCDHPLGDKEVGRGREPLGRGVRMYLSFRGL